MTGYNGVCQFMETEHLKGVGKGNERTQEMLGGDCFFCVGGGGGCGGWGVDVWMCVCV